MHLFHLVFKEILVLSLLEVVTAYRGFEIHRVQIGNLYLMAETCQFCNGQVLQRCIERLFRLLKTLSRCEGYDYPLILTEFRERYASQSI